MLFFPCLPAILHEPQIIRKSRWIGTKSNPKIETFPKGFISGIIRHNFNYFRIFEVHAILQEGKKKTTSK